MQCPRQLEREFVEVFRRLRIDDVRLREWFLEVIRAKAADGQQRGLEHKAELDRQNGVIEAKLKTLLELRIDGEISTDDFSAKRSELHQRQTEIRRQLEDAQAGTGEIADRAVKVFELSQSLENRWKNGDFHAKRELLDILCENVRLNSEKVEIALRKPFDVIESLSGVSVNGAGGNRTPVPRQSTGRLYACSRCFVVNRRAANDSVSFGPAHRSFSSSCLRAPHDDQPDASFPALSGVGRGTSRP